MRVNKLLRLRFGVVAVQERCRDSHVNLAKLHYKIFGPKQHSVEAMMHPSGDFLSTPELDFEVSQLIFICRTPAKEHVAA